jgi:hypothetical protein
LSAKMSMLFIKLFHGKMILKVKVIKPHIHDHSVQ